jgi:hypothetical protein
VLLTDHLFTTEPVSEGHPDKICDPSVTPWTKRTASAHPLGTVGVTASAWRLTQKSARTTEVRVMHQMSGPELQAVLRRLCEEAIRLYTKGSWSPTPERIIQVYCALELIKLSFVVAVETTGRAVQALVQYPGADRARDLRSVRRWQSGQGKASGLCRV